MMETRVGTGSDRKTTTMNRDGYWRVLDISSKRPGDEVPNRIALAGASINTTNAIREPARDQNRMARLDLRDRESPNHQAEKIAKTSRVIINATGGSEKPPTTKDATKQITKTQKEGKRSPADLICFKINVPRKVIKTRGAK